MANSGKQENRFVVIPLNLEEPREDLPQPSPALVQEFVLRLRIVTSITVDDQPVRKAK